MDEVDRRLVNALQHGFPVCERPYAEAARAIGITETGLIERLQRLLDDKVLTRFGPLYDAERLGGAVSLCAIAAPEADFDRVAEQVNAFPEVAHNYARDHELNMWFVVATEKPERLADVVTEIEQCTGYRVYDMPKLEEFYVGLRLTA